MRTAVAATAAAAATVELAAATEAALLELFECRLQSLWVLGV